MGLRRKERRVPQIRANVKTTYWWMDDAIDRGGSDMMEWFRTADTEHIVPLPGETPAAIRWRPLYDWEMDGLGFGDDSEAALILRCIEAFRIGLVSIEGFNEGAYRLQRKRSSSISRLTDETLAMLYQEIAEAKLPYGRIVAVVLEGANKLTREQAQDVFSQVEDKRAPMALAVWLGGHILAASFRALRAGAGDPDEPVLEPAAR